MPNPVLVSFTCQFGLKHFDMFSIISLDKHKQEACISLMCSLNSHDCVKSVKCNGVILGLYLFFYLIAPTPISHCSQFVIYHFSISPSSPSASFPKANCPFPWLVIISCSNLSYLSYLHFPSRNPISMQVNTSLFVYLDLCCSLLSPHFLTSCSVSVFSSAITL